MGMPLLSPTLLWRISRSPSTIGTLWKADAPDVTYPSHGRQLGAMAIRMRPSGPSPPMFIARVA